MTLRAEPGERPGGSDGFTLIETIIVLVVLGLLAGILVSRGPMRSPTVDIRSTATRLLQGMRAARAQAIAANRTLPFSVDAQTHSYRIGRGLPQALPADVGLELLVAGRSAPSISFAPDGSSGGGTIRLAAATRRMSVSVDWLTGHMRIDDAAP